MTLNEKEIAFITEQCKQIYMEGLTMRGITQDNLDNRFTYHPPIKDQADRYKEIRKRAKNFAELVVCYTPTSREQSLAITKIEEAVYHANAAIARNE